MLDKTSIILECSRVFSLPMTVMSWLIVFTYGILNSGDSFLGILALIGVTLVHLATNVLDDYFDYKSLIKRANFDKTEYLKNTQKTKCRCILLGLITEKQLLLLALIYLAIAGGIGLYLYLQCGKGILYFATIGGLIGVLYAFLSKIKLSELAVSIAYGPALFGGIYYVMTKTFSWEVMLLCIPSMTITVILLYVHMVMDFNFDVDEGKNTIANSFNSQLDALIVLKILLMITYTSPILLCIFDIADWQVFLVYLTIPLAIDLYKSMIQFSINSKSIPEYKWYHFPMENKKRLQNLNAWSFMTRMYQARNLLIYFSLLLTLSLFLALS